MQLCLLIRTPWNIVSGKKNSIVKIIYFYFYSSYIKKTVRLYLNVSTIEDDNPAIKKNCYNKRNSLFDSRTL